MTVTEAGSLEALEKQRETLRHRLALISDLRPGSLLERYRRCGRPTCHCAQADSSGHGPSWSLTWAEEGKTVTRVIAAGSAVEQTRKQLAEYQKFRDLVRQFVRVSSRLCDTRLRGETAEGLGAAEKGGSRRRWRRRSPRRSKRS